MTETKEHALQLNDAASCFIKFYEESKNRIYIHGCLGAASYVDKTVTVEEARNYWQEKIAEGWHQVDISKAPKRDWWFWN